MVFINKCKFCEISNQLFFNFQKQKKNWLWNKYCKIKLFGAFSHGASNEPGACLEPCQTSEKNIFAKIVNDYKLLTIFTEAPL